MCNKKNPLAVSPNLTTTNKADFRAVHMWGRSVKSKRGVFMHDEDKTCAGVRRCLLVWPA